MLEWGGTSEREIATLKKAGFLGFYLFNSAVCPQAKAISTRTTLPAKKCTLVSGGGFFPNFIVLS